MLFSSALSMSRTDRRYPQYLQHLCVNSYRARYRYESNLYIFLNFDTSKWLVSSHFTLYHTQIPHDYHTKVPFDLITFPLTIPKSYLTCSHTRVPPGPLPYPSPTWPFTIPKLHHLILSKKNPAWPSTTQFPPDYWYEKSHPTLSKVPPNPLSYNSIWLYHTKVTSYR